jgi:hypothetical protein
MENWYYEQPSLPENYQIGVTPSGYITDAMAYDWLHFFQESTKDHIWRGEYRLLLMDGHGSHKTHEFLQFCNEHRIIAYCFPSYTTHLL